MEGADGDDLWNIAFDDIELDEGAEIGRGQFGAVYKGTLLGSEVAVKKILRIEEADAKYMKREQELLRQLAHSNIVQFFGICQHDGFVWLVSEYAAQGNLSKHLYNVEEAIAWSRRLRWAVDAVQAIAFVHSKSLVHRDIKSENLLLDSNDKVKLCDFGFARKVEKKLEKLGNKKAQQQLTIAGTDEWMAPEVIVGTPYGQAADIFSFGVTLTEFIMRRKPEERHPRNAFDFEVEEFRQALPKDCPPEFATLVIECCKYEPKARPDAKVMIRGLKELQKIVTEREKGSSPPSSSVISAAAAVSEPTPVVSSVVPSAATGSVSPREADLVAAKTSPRPVASSGSGKTSSGGSANSRLNGPYIGLNPVQEDEESPSSLPNENGLLRNITINAPPSKEGRMHWVQFQDAIPSQKEGMLKVAFGKDASAKSTKLYCILVHDVLYYFKNNKKGEKNLGRVLLDSQLEVALLPTDKTGKKMALVLTTGLKETVRLVGPVADLGVWSSAILEGKSSALDLAVLFRPSSPAGQSIITQDPGRVSFPVRLSTAPNTLLLCVDRDGVKILQAFLEDTLLEIPWAALLKWQISRNEVIQLYVSAASAKKPVEMEFCCVAWVTASRVFDALEASSKMAAPAAPQTVSLKRTSMLTKK